MYTDDGAIIIYLYEFVTLFKAGGETTPAAPIERPTQILRLNVVIVESIAISIPNQPYAIMHTGKCHLLK